MSEKTEIHKSMKVYTVRTGWVDKDMDSQNWNSYTILAHDADEAIERAAPKFKTTKAGYEYPESVELVAVLDD